MAVFVIPYTVPGNYTYPTDKILVSGGIVTIKEDLSNVYARWHLNEISGTNIPDSSGNGRNGSTVAMEDGDWVAGKLNNCLRFNEGSGKNEYIVFGDIAEFDVTDSFSFEFWIKVLNWPYSHIRICRKYDNAISRGYSISIESDRVDVTFDDLPSGKSLEVRSYTPITLDAWHHIVVTYNGSSQANGVEVYVDGEQKAKSVLSDTLLGASIINSSQLAFGQSGNYYHLNGYLDEVVVYDRVITLAEVGYRYNTGIGREKSFLFSDKPTIYKTNGDSDVAILAFTNFLETMGPDNEGFATYQLSSDGVTWQYWNGAGWVTAGANDYNSAAIIAANIAAFACCVQSIYIKAFLISNGAQVVDLDENRIEYDPIGMYCTVQDLRDEGITVSMLSDANALRKINVASKYIERVTGRWFEPRTRTFYLDGDGNSTLRVGHPIIEITGIATITGRGASLDEDDIELDEVRIYNRHLTQGLTRPDDRARPRIEFPQLTDPWARRDVHDGFWRAIRQWRAGRVNVKVEGVFGYTDLQPGDQVGETSAGSQVPLSYGSTPALIAEVCKALVVRDLGQMGRPADREDWANRYRIEMEKTGDQQYKMTSLDKLGLSGAWTGDPYIDGILAMFVATRSQVEAV